MLFFICYSRIDLVHMRMQSVQCRSLFPTCGRVNGRLCVNLTVVAGPHHRLSARACSCRAPSVALADTAVDHSRVVQQDSGQTRAMRGIALGRVLPQYPALDKRKMMIQTGLVEHNVLEIILYAGVLFTR